MCSKLNFDRNNIIFGIISCLGLGKTNVLIHVKFAIKRWKKSRSLNRQIRLGLKSFTTYKNVRQNREIFWHEFENTIFRDFTSSKKSLLNLCPNKTGPKMWNWNMDLIEQFAQVADKNRFTKSSLRRRRQRKRFSDVVSSLLQSTNKNIFLVELNH